MPLAGMAIFKQNMPRLDNLDIVYSGDKRCESETHGGFDNDPATMNDILRTVTGRIPKKETRFTPEELDY